MGIRKNKFQNFTGTEKTQVKLLCVKFHFVKFEDFEVCFLELPYKPFLWSYFISLIRFIALGKCKKDAISLKLFWYEVFVS